MISIRLSQFRINMTSQKNKRPQKGYRPATLQTECGGAVTLLRTGHAYSSAKSIH